MQCMYNLIINSIAFEYVYGLNNILDFGVPLVVDYFNYYVIYLFEVIIIFC